MTKKVNIEYMDVARGLAREAVTEYGASLPEMQECDIRIEISEGKGASVENGAVRHSGDDYGFSLGVHALAGNNALGSGYVGKQLGASDTKFLGRVLRESIDESHARALANARAKERARGIYKLLGGSLADLNWAQVPIEKKVIEPVYKQDPREVGLPTVISAATSASRAISELSPSVAYNAVAASTGIIRECFVSSEGIEIDAAYAQTEAMVLVVASGAEGNLEFYDFIGHQRGWEIIENGVDSGPIQLPNLQNFAVSLARDTIETASAPRMKTTNGEVPVVLDPHFAALIAHEVVGHPSELDRALKYETGYAGRSWFMKKPGEDQRGKQIASSIVSAFSDPTIEGFGHYQYDHEGTPARRVYHIQDGIFQEFVNNRQTASLFGVEANGSCRATDASLVPMVRMTNTTFAPGKDDPTNILKDIEHGYFVAGHRIPSVAESRENFRISAMKTYEIKNGEIGQLYRDGSLMADTKDFFMSIDAMGTDWKLWPVPNCGKGQPMQTKRMSNGGPTMRGIAKIAGASS